MIQGLGSIKFLGYETIVKNKKEISWFITTDIKDFVEMIAYDEVPVYYNDFFDDLQYDLINEKNIEGYIDRVCELTEKDSQKYKSLVDLKDDLLKVVKNPSVRDFRKLLDKFNEHLSLNGEYTKYLYFNNIDRAYEYVKNNYDVDDLNLLEIFS